MATASVASHVLASIDVEAAVKLLESGDSSQLEQLAELCANDSTALLAAFDGDVLEAAMPFLYNSILCTHVMTIARAISLG